MTFPGHDGGELAGRLELPYAGEPRAVAIFAHCFSCGQDSRAATAISRTLAAEGIATLRFDFTGWVGLTVILPTPTTAPTSPIS